MAGTERKWKSMYLKILYNQRNKRWNPLTKV